PTVGLLVEPLPRDPRLVHVAVVADGHDAEEDLGRLIDGLRAAAGDDERLVPAHGRLAGVPVEGDEVGLLALVEVAQDVVEAEGSGAAHRRQRVPAVWAVPGEPFARAFKSSRLRRPTYPRAVIAAIRIARSLLSTG